MEILHSLTSFKMFHLLSKKETLQFIHRVVTQSVNTNNQYASPGIIEKKEANGANKPLSQREGFVLNSLARKITPAAIGKMAGIIIKTVSAHKMNAMRKLGLTSPQFLQLLVGLSEVKNISTMVLKEPPK
ncbi:DNA-binding transcriptional activator BglJ [compost metagenome]